MRPFRIAGGVAVVTGAASGIGLRLATRLADAGCSLALVDINGAALSALGERLGRPGVKVSVHPLDVGRRDDVLALPARVLDVHGRVTLLVNNAGVAMAGRLDQVELDAVERLIEINLFGVIRMTYAFLPALQRERAAHIVNLSSLFGFVAPPGQTAYAAAKFGVRGFSESLRHEMRGTRLGVTVVHPGGVRTSITATQVMSPVFTEEDIARVHRRAEKLLTLDPDEAARQIVEAIVRRRRRLVIGRDAKQVMVMQRLFPVSYWSVVEATHPVLRREHRQALSLGRLARGAA